MGAYQDYVSRHATSSKPHCFGDPDYYDDTDIECAETCVWRKECRPLVARKNLKPSTMPGGVMQPRSRTLVRPAQRALGKRKYGTLELAEGESPWNRLVREMAATALSGAAEEFSVFFQQYRFPYTPPAELQMKCDCGGPINLSSKFCPGCGASLQ